MLGVNKAVETSHSILEIFFGLDKISLFLFMQHLENKMNFLVLELIELKKLRKINILLKK